MDAMDSSHESDHDLIPSDILEKNIAEFRPIETLT